MSTIAAIPGLDTVVNRILLQRETLFWKHSLLVGISGIDGSGKGYITGRITEALQTRGQKTATINIDGWLNLPEKRFNSENPARHFYEHAIRFPELFSQLILPLKHTRNNDIIMNYAEETASEYRRHGYSFRDIDIILLEGIYLFKRQYRPFFDFAVWLECSFETALERAVNRSQEGLPPEETRSAYRTIYFPAQKIHFAKDNPHAAADCIVYNDLQRSASDNKRNEYSQDSTTATAGQRYEPFIIEKQAVVSNGENSCGGHTSFVDLLHF